MRDFYDDYGDPKNRKDIVRRQLARIGLSLDDPSSTLSPAPLAPAKPPTPEEQRYPEAFLTAPGHHTISAVLAAQMHWTPSAPRSEGAPIDAPLPPDDEGYEGLRRPGFEAGTPEDRDD